VLRRTRRSVGRSARRANRNAPRRLGAEVTSSVSSSGQAGTQLGKVQLLLTMRGAAAVATPTLSWRSAPQRGNSFCLAPAGCYMFAAVCMPGRAESELETATVSNLASPA